MKKVLFGLIINKITFDDLLEDLLYRAKSRKCSYLCAVNSHMAVLSQSDPELHEAVNRSNWSVTDGVPISWAFSLIHRTKQKRVAGMDLTPALIGLASENGLVISVIGNTKRNLVTFENKIRDSFPNAAIGALISPPFRELAEKENNLYINEINKARTNILFVSLGCPKQEKWMLHNHRKINAVCLGIGNAINTFIGAEKRPPTWVQKVGMEWFFRLVQNPKRLFRRYIITNTKFCVLFLVTVVKKVF